MMMMMMMMMMFFVFEAGSHYLTIYNPSCPGNHDLDQDGLRLRDLPASAFQVLGLKVCATMASNKNFFMCMDVLPAVRHIHAVPAEARRGHQIS